MDVWHEVEKELRQCSLTVLEKLATGLGTTDDSSWKDETTEVKKQKKLTRVIGDIVDEVDERDQAEHIQYIFLPHLPIMLPRNLLTGIFKEDKSPGIYMRPMDADSSFAGAVWRDGW